MQSLNFLFPLFYCPTPAVDLQKRIKKMENRKAREAEKHGTSDSIEVIREKEKRAKEAYKRMYRDIQKVRGTAMCNGHRALHST